MGRPCVIAIDGPAASGKSTVARQLARRLGFRYLDTGAMYRALTWLAMKKGLDLKDGSTIAALVDEITVEEGPLGMRVKAAGQDVTREIRNPEVTAKVRLIADSPEVRSRMRLRQRAFAQGAPTVAEGRDMTSAVFPDASFKVYLDADLDLRAARRRLEYQKRPDARRVRISKEEVLAEIKKRDEEDFARPVAPLKRMGDAIYVDTSAMNVEEVVALLEERIRSGLKA